MRRRKRELLLGLAWLYDLVYKTDSCMYVWTTTVKGGTFETPTFEEKEKRTDPPPWKSGTFSWSYISWQTGETTFLQISHTHTCASSVSNDTKGVVLCWMNHHLQRVLQWVGVLRAFWSAGDPIHFKPSFFFASVTRYGLPLAPCEIWRSVSILKTEE